MPMIANEKGKILRINTGYNLSDATAFELAVEDPNGNAFVINGVFSVGNVDVTDNESGETLLAFQYVEYVTDGTEFTQEGDYLLKLSGDFGADKTLKSVDKTQYVYA
ncbi:MAG: hypothetical protein OEY11_15060 [Gammaproteobacteria bacterium]|nr:hypothetical protein [Gammaproteobacteria bacterium]